MRESTQKKILLTALVDRGWRQVEVDHDGVDWWAFEHWRMRSVRESPGLEIVITFQHVGEPWETNSDDPVSDIVATTEMPTPGTPATEIASCRYRRHFERMLPDFLDELDEHRWQRE